MLISEKKEKIVSSKSDEIIVEIAPSAISIVMKGAKWMHNEIRCCQTIGCRII